MDLPQELVDAIVDNIHHDIPSLKSCSLAARPFVDSARKHIFRKIEITHPLSSYSNTCELFYKLLCSSPHIAPLVEDLCIVSSDSDRRNWAMSSGTLCLVLPLLNLTRISIIENGQSGISYSRSWNKMDQHLQSALADVFSSPRLEAVHLRGLVLESPSQLLLLFAEATALKEMSLSRLYFTQAEYEPWPELQLWHPKLRSLLVNDFRSDPFCHYLTNPRFDLSRVSTLTVGTRSVERMSTIMQATNAGPSSVEHLRLLLWDERSWNGNFFSANLRFLHLFTFSGFGLGLLGTVFKTCPHDSCLEQLTLEGTVNLHELPSHSEELDAAIDTTVNHLRALKIIEIRPTTSPDVLWMTSIIRATMTGSSDTFTAWKAAAQAVLPSLMRRGMLHIIGIETRGPGWE
ncbi:hypothetical protein DFH08DRAFT_1088818 [Mycena albidolilacea]|uniref:Uncharacterized protein n=1 Tax=Mycena albidolilacea TaxID=1033008 RepID=A0AAD7EA94_9AGAR|nr:hypothetical protein DFH08DRAFT_1088818 [Mycena albidolilacea]